MPESGYGFMPEGEPRSFAGWVGHVADAQANQCGGLAGTPLQLGAGQMTTKADLVAALKKSFDACDAAFNALTDENAMEPFTGGRGGPQPKAVAAYGMIIHSNECYGAMAVYMRLQKLTPPSSAKHGAAAAVPGGGGGARSSNKVSSRLLLPFNRGGRFVREIVEHARHTFHPASARASCGSSSSSGHRTTLAVMPSTESMGRSTTESGRSAVPNGISTTGNCHTWRSNPDSCDKRRTMASARRSRPSRSARQASRMGAHLWNARGRAHGHHHSIHPLIAIHQVRGLFGRGRKIVDRQNRAIGPRIALHAHGSHRQHPLRVAALDRRSPDSAPHRQRMARPGPGRDGGRAAPAEIPSSRPIARTSSL